MLVWLAAFTIAFCGSSCKKQQASNHVVTLRWQASPGAHHYNVYRSSTQGVRGGKIGTSTEPAYRDTGVPGGTVFYYTVTAVIGGKESGPSNEIKAVVPP